MLSLLAILSIILFLITIYTHEVIRKEYGNPIIPGYLYIIIGLSGIIAVLLLVN
jgi:hypothetical protein